ncbi:hypothetical protein RB199_26530 [Streptomyces libani]
MPMRRVRCPVCKGERSAKTRTGHRRQLPLLPGHRHHPLNHTPTHRE